MQDSGASCIFGEVESDAEVQGCEATMLGLSDSVSERARHRLGTSHQKKRQWEAYARGGTHQMITPRRK